MPLVQPKTKERSPSNTPSSKPRKPSDLPASQSPHNANIYPLTIFFFFVKHAIALLSFFLNIEVEVVQREKAKVSGREVPHALTWRHVINN